MKQIFKTLVLVAAAVATLTSCEKAPEVTPAAEEFTLTVNATLPAPDGTKTYLGVKVGTDYPVLWSENDEIRLYEVSYATEGGTAELTSGTSKSNYATSDEIIRSNENTEATFAGLTPENPIANADLFDYIAYYGNISNMGMFRRYNDPPYLKVTVPNTQTISVANQFDTSAALMAAKQLGYATRQTTLDLNFKHLVAYGILNITNLDCGTEKILSVTFSNNNHNITGQSKYLYTTANDELEIDTKNVSKEVTVDLSNLDDVDAESFYVPFAIAPTTFVAGDIITIKVATDQNVYTREITLTAAQAEKFDFVQGSIIEFSASFEGVGLAEVVKYQLVESASGLAAGDVVLLVAMKGSGYYAAGAMSTYLASVAVNAPVDKVISITNEEIDQFILSAGDTDNAWKFESTLQPGKFIGWTSGNSATYSAEGTKAEWKISIAEGKATISNVSTPERLLQYNSSNPRFAAYTSSQVKPAIYKKVTE